MHWTGLANCIQQCELNNNSSTLDELFATPSSIGSLIIQTSSVALTYLYLRTKTHGAVRTDNNPDKSGSQQQSTLDMLRSMAAQSAATAQQALAAPTPERPTMTHSSMESLSDRIP